MDNNEEEEWPYKRARVEAVPTTEQVVQPLFAAGGDYEYMTEMGEMFHRMNKEVKLHSKCAKHMFAIDGRLADLSIDHLLAIEGHFLGVQ